MPDRVCLAHPRHTAEVPMELHHVRPIARGGLGTPTVQLCANAHGAVHDLLDLIESHALTTPYATVREVIRAMPPADWARYSGPVRVIAYRGWQEYGLGFLGGRYGLHHRLWDSRGIPRSALVPRFEDIAHAARWSRRWRKELERLG
jgi:hypothetical protein